MSTWTLATLGGLVLLVAVVPGVCLWWPSRGDRSARSDLGVALMTGTIVAFAVLLVQVLFDLRLAQLEDARRAQQDHRTEILRQQADRQDLQLTFGLRRDLSGIDLRRRDLRGFYLSRKVLRDAQLVGARLDAAFLSEADLTAADLRRARLPRAVLDDALLDEALLTGADLSNASLVGAKLREADLSQADLRGASFDGARLTDVALGGARYDVTTTWPKDFRMKPCPIRQTCVVS